MPGILNFTDIFVLLRAGIEESRRSYSSRRRRHLGIGTAG